MMIRILTIGCLLVVAALTAAEPTSTLAGTLLDPAGAVVVGAKVLAVNTETGLTRQMQSGGDGGFVIPLLPVGTYKVTVDATGFGRYEQTGIRLMADQSVTTQIHLKIGSASEVVEVTASGEMVEARSGALSQVINEQKIIELPINGRNAASLVLLAPGVIDLRAGNSSGTGDTVQTVTYPGAVSIAANGGRADTANYNLDGGSNQDTYTNVNNPFPNPDGVEEFSVQTNSFSAEYGRGSGAIVNVVTKSGTNQLHGSLFEFFRNGNLNARNYFAAGHDLLKRNQFGGSVGGPVVKNKLFFFGTYQGTQIRDVQNGRSATVLTAAQRAGNFSSVSRQLIDPVTKAPYPGNIIPTSSLNPVSLKLLQYLPVANSADGLTRYDLPDSEHENQYMGRVDYLRGNQRLYGRYLYTDYQRVPIIGASNLLTATRGFDLPTHSASLNHTYTISPTLLNSLVVSISRSHSQILSGAPFSLADLGVSNVAHSDPSELVIEATGYFTVNSGHPGTFDRNNFQVTDSLHWVKGKHELAMGGDIMRSSFDGVNTYRQNGSFRFRGTSYSGNPLADFMVGYADRFLQGGGEYTSRRGNMGSMFVQDNWKASKNLVLSLGLRWDPFTPPGEEKGRTECFIPGQKSVRFPNAPVGYLYAGDSGCQSGGVPSNWKQLAPRLGISYNPHGGKTVIRAGAGLFYQPPFLEAFNNMADSAPFSPQVQLFRVPFNNPYVATFNPFPAQFAPIIPPSSVAFVTPLSLAVSYARDWKPSRVMNWNFTVERQVGADLLARASYVGSKGTHLNYNTDLNAPRQSATATADNEDARRPYSQFVQLTQDESGANSTFHALQLSLEKRFSHGFTASANYTWSKSMDTVSYSTDLDTINIINPYNINAYRGVSDFNIPHRLLINYVWKLPSPKGKLMNAVLGGWETSGIWTFQTGFPLNISSGNDTSFSLPTVGNDQAQLLCNPKYTDGSRANRIASWFQTSCFGVPQDNTFGNVGRNTLIGPGTFNVDAGAHKVFSVREHVKVQFRAEFFNAFNHTQLNNPDTTVSDSNFGRITSARAPRIVQLALRLSF